MNAKYNKEEISFNKKFKKNSNEGSSLSQSERISEVERFFKKLNRREQFYLLERLNHTPMQKSVESPHSSYSKKNAYPKVQKPSESNDNYQKLCVQIIFHL